MPRLFLGNFDFEHRLANSKRKLPAKLERINAELATSWLAIAEDGDFLWTPQPIKASFFEQAVTQGLPRVMPVASFDDVPRDVECVPWGWTDDVRRLCDKHGWKRNDPPDAAVRAANSRRMSAALEREWRVGLDFSGEVRSLHEIEQFIEQHGSTSRWLIKAEFGMSGRERIVGSGSLNGMQRSWVLKRLEADGAVFFEPWVERIEEVGIQIDVPRTGDPALIQIVPLLVDDQGQYAGSWFASPQNLTFTQDLMTGNSGVEVALRAARRLQDLGYFGPLGIDAMRYRAADQSVRLRPLQDINARWTMGRLSVGWNRLRKPGNRWGLWCHSTGKQIDSKTRAVVAVMRFRAFLKMKGMHLNFIREAIMRTVMSLPEDFDPETLVTEFGNLAELLGASRSTIHRTLLLMQEAGLIRTFSDIESTMKPVGDLSAIPDTIPTSPDQIDDQPAAHKSFVVFG